MNKATFYALVGAGLMYVRERVKKRKTTAAVKGAVLGFLAVTQVAPRVGLTLPAPKSIRG